MDLIIWSIVFVVSLLVLVKASDGFVTSAEKIGISLGMSPFLVGVVIVGVGTSLPELISSIIGVLNHASEIVIGNVLGSNITNIFLVLGLAAIIARNFNIQHDLFHFDMPILLGSAFMLALMIRDGDFSIGEALICLVCMGLYLFQFFEKSDEPDISVKIRAANKDWLLMLASPVLIFVGAKYTVEAVIRISEMVGISTEVIALSVVALGTSLPEVLVTVSAARRGNAEMAVGNVVGSNIFNTLAVMGISALFGKIVISPGVIEFSLPVFICATMLCWVIIVDRRINRWEGALMLVFYVFFICRLYDWV